MGIQGFADARRRWLVAFSTVAIVLSLFPGAISAAAPAGIAAFHPVTGDPEVTPSRARTQPLEGQKEDEDEFLLKQEDATIDPPDSPATGTCRSMRRPGIATPPPTRRRHSRRPSRRSRRSTFTGPWTEISPEPDRPGQPRQQHVLRGVRARQRPGHPPEQRPEDPRRRPGRHLDLRRGHRHLDRRARTTRPPCRSAPSPSPRRTTRSSTPAPARATCRATATSATAS